MGRDALVEGAGRIGAFDAETLDDATASLVAQGLLRALGDGSVTLTRDGEALAARAPAY